MSDEPINNPVQRNGNPFKASRLGFGLSSIAGVASRKRQLQLLNSALDAGISHFDVAPYYGSGDAEQILGNFAQGRRNRMTIATKFGIESAFGRPGLRLIRQIARKVFKLLPGLKRGASSLAGSAKPRTNYSPQALRGSVHRSLGQLRVERIDFLLLHDWPAEAALAEDIIAELASLMAAGDIHAAGLASSSADALAVARAEAPALAVVQLENSLLSPVDTGPMTDAGKYVITHRAMSQTLDAAQRLLALRPGLRELWQAELGMDLEKDHALPLALLEWALLRNAAGTVIFSTTRPERVLDNARLLERPILGPDRCQLLESLFSNVRSVAMALLDNVR